jgi:hypothetical protein
MFGMFPSTGAQSHNLTEFANELDGGGYRPENSGRLPSCSRSSWPVRFMSIDIAARSCFVLVVNDRLNQVIFGDPLQQNCR